MYAEADMYLYLDGCLLGGIVHSLKQNKKTLPRARIEPDTS